VDGGSVAAVTLQAEVKRLADEPRSNVSCTWSPLQLRQFLAGINTDPLYPLMLTLCMVGCRTGDALALRVGDVLGSDDRSSALWIRHTTRQTSGDRGTKWS
jgi:hypothetical protein